uniref:Ig-like domain-containing protein n=1 Tax=Strigamia maritima TaxID=126957 RepID=T1JK32_STRMM
VKQFYKVQVYDEFVIKGNIAVLKCHVPSFVKDYITVTSWLKDDVDIHAYPEAKRFVRLSTGELYIYDVSLEDGSRTYRCKTRHKLTGEVVLSSSGRLIVTDPKSSVPPRISHGLGNVVSKLGQTTELPCAAQAYPAPTY